MAGQTKSIQNYISATYPDGRVEVLFTPLDPIETPKALENIFNEYKCRKRHHNEYSLEWWNKKQAEKKLRGGGVICSFIGKSKRSRSLSVPSTRGLRENTTLFNGMIVDVNTKYFEERSGYLCIASKFDSFSYLENKKENLYIF